MNTGSFPHVTGVLAAYHKGREALALLINRKQQIVNLIHEVWAERAADRENLKLYWDDIGEPVRHPLCSRTRLVHCHDDDILNVYTESRFNSSDSFAWDLPSTWLSIEDEDVKKDIHKLVDEQLALCRAYRAVEDSTEEQEARAMYQRLRERFEPS